MAHLKDITKEADRGSYLMRVQRGVVVQVKGKRGTFIVLKRDGAKRGTKLYLQKQVEGERIQARTQRSRYGGRETKAEQARDHFRADHTCQLQDVTHVQVHDRPRRRRAPRW